MIGSGGGLIRTQWLDGSIASLACVRPLNGNNIGNLPRSQDGYLD